MKYLIIDTSSKKLLLSASNGEGEILLCATNIDRYGSSLSAIVMQTLDNLHLQVSDLDFVGAGVGPGSLTGLRVGLATLKGMILPFDIPVVTFNSLDLIAREIDRDDYVVMRKGREGFYYWRRYNKGRPLGETRFDSIEDISAAMESPGRPVYMETVVSKKLPYNLQFQAEASPTPSTMSQLVKELFSAGEKVSYTDLVPVYLQRSIAEINWDNRHSRET